MSDFDSNNPNTLPTKELNSAMNAMVAGMAAGLNLNKKISGQISSLSMNIGKVISTSNNIVRQAEIHNQKLDNLHHGLTSIDNSIKALIGMVKSGEGTEKTNRSIGNLSGRLTTLANKQEQLNKTLSDYFNSNKTNAYDNIENTMEKRTDVLTDSLNSMSATLLSIDKTLKSLGGIAGTQPTPSATNPTVAAGAGAAAWEATKRIGSNISDTVGSVSKSMGGMLSGLGSFWAIDSMFDQKVMDENKQIYGPKTDAIKKQYGETVLKNAREKFTPWYLPTTGIDEYDASDEDYIKQYNEWQKTREPIKSDNTNGPVWERYGRVGPNTTPMDMAIGGQMMNDYYSKEAAPPPPPPSSDKRSSLTPAALPASYLMASGGASSPYTSSSSTSDGVISIPSMNTPVGVGLGVTAGSFNTAGALASEQAKIEEQSKNMTSADMSYQVNDLSYKANNIKFEAGNIQFMGASGASSSGGAMGGGFMNASYGGGGGGGRYGGGASGEDAVPTELTGDAKKSFDNIMSGKSETYTGSQVSSFAGLSNDELAAGGIRRVEGRGASGGTTYEKMPLTPEQAKSKLKSGLTGKLEGGSFDKQAPIVMNRLMKDFGLTKEQAAGILGNLGHESAGLQAGIQEGNPVGGGRGGLGWAQWTGPRRRAFEKYLAETGQKATDPEANYGFLKRELETTEKGSIAAVKKAHTAEEATLLFEQAFERAGIKAYGNRQHYTNKAMKGYDPSAGTGTLTKEDQELLKKIEAGQVSDADLVKIAKERGYDVGNEAAIAGSLSGKKTPTPEPKTPVVPPDTVKEHPDSELSVSNQKPEETQRMASVQRTETMNREQARIREMNRDRQDRDTKVIQQTVANREAPGPKNPKIERKDLDSVLVRHNDWWKNWSATA